MRLIAGSLPASSVLVALLCLGAATAAGCGDHPPVRVVLVTIDSLRYDALVEDRGDAKASSSMPHLLRQAREGALFENFFSAAARTEPSLAAMLTGLPPWDHHPIREGRPLDPRVETIAEVLSQRGFFTGAVVPSSSLRRHLGFAQGFEEFWDGSGRGELDPDESRTSAAASDLTSLALRLIDRASAGAAADAPGQFLWFHFDGLGDPYGDLSGGRACSTSGLNGTMGSDAGAEVTRRRCHRAYDEDAAFLDREVERLLSRLDKDRRWATHVLLVADHGESFRGGESSDDLMRAVRDQIHVPLVILSPRLRNQVRRDVASSIDVARTVLSLAGVKYPDAPFSSARDLTAWAPDPSIDPQATAGLRIGALGILQGPASPTPPNEGRFDLPAAPVFYAVDRAGRVFIGNAAELFTRPPGSGPAAEDQAHVLFESLAVRARSDRAPRPR